MRPRPFAGLSGWRLARRVVAPALFVGALFFSLLTYEAPPTPTAGDHTEDEVTLSGEALGTTWTVRVVGPAPDEASQGAIATAIQAALAEVDGLMSTYKAESELSRLNRWTDAGPFLVSAPTMAVLMRSETVWRESGGAFDITVRPLVRAWGFDGADADHEPDAATLAALMEDVGQDKLQLNHQALTVTKSRPTVTADLSAIAKGYAVDRVSLALQQLGYGNTMVEVGGEVRASGWNRNRQPWRIAVERPDTTARTVEQVVSLSNLSMATSGDYRNFREVDGRRWSHTIDPRTGRALLHAVASATVLHEECSLADAYATAIMVLGEEQGIEMAERLQLPVLLLIRNADGSFTHRASSAFAAHQAREHRSEAARVVTPTPEAP